MQTIWQPVNLSELCPPNAPVLACSPLGYVYLNLVVQLFGGSKDLRIQKQFGIHDDGPSGEEVYDFIVIGAGTAGCVVANRLTEIEDWKVLLLEAGPEEPDVTSPPAMSRVLRGSNIDWNYSTEPNGMSCFAYAGQRCVWPRGKVMGGSSSINTMAYVRGNKLDYDTWAAMGNKGWSYKDVLPYFKKSEANMNIEILDRKYHGSKGEQSVARFPYIDQTSVMLSETANDGGIPILDFNAAIQEGTMRAQSFSYSGKRASSNVAFIRPIRYKRKNLTVRPNSEAVKILIDQHKRAYGVQYVKNGKLHTALARKEIISSAGTINSPKLLMLSGIGPKKHLEQLHIPVVVDLDVGYNLHDHVTFNGLILAFPNETSTLVSFQQMLNYIRQYHDMELKKGPISSVGPVNTVTFFKTNPGLPAPDVQFQSDSCLTEEAVQDMALAEATSIWPTVFYNCVIVRPMNNVPKSRGRLTLNVTDPHASPIIQPNYFGNPEDLIPLKAAVRFAISLENSEPIKKSGAYYVKTPLPPCNYLSWGSDAYTECLARTFTSSPYHPVGTCKMGPEWDETSVVNPRLRVYGMSGLRVIDASIMPVVPRGNTNAPALMVGERGVTFVLEDWLPSHEYLKYKILNSLKH